ncbi:MAG: DEAD/DEAH box helicase [Nitrososphaerota archaeon]
MGLTFRDNIILAYGLNSKQIEVVKKLPSRRWNGKTLCWEIPICRANIKQLVLSKEFEDSEEIKKILNEYIRDYEIKKRISVMEIPIDFSKYKIQPYRYQKEGIYFVVISRRAIIADEPGLGKTMQAIIGADQLYSGSGYIVVICPRTLVYNWVYEINKVMGYVDTESIPEILANAPVYVASGFSAREIPIGMKWIICGYSQFTPDGRDTSRRTWSAYLSSKEIDTLILDEAHRVKNPKANRTRNIRRISKMARNLIMLSGTIMMNNVEELWSPLNMISENDFPSKTEFCDRFMKSYELKVRNVPFPIKKYYGIKNEAELRKVIFPFVIRRIKKDVFDQMPPKVRSFIPFDLPEEYVDEYKKMLDEFIDYLIIKGELERAIKASRAVQLVQSMELMKFISKIKCFLAEDVLEEKLSVGKCIAFCTYKESAKILADLFHGRSYIITGDQPISRRQQIVYEFKKSDLNDLLILTYGAGSEGFNLEESSNAVMIDFNWVPAVMLQAEDRIHRITSKNNVFINYLYISDTIDEVIYKTIKDKILSIDKVFSLDKDIIEDFVKNLDGGINKCREVDSF